MLRRICHKFHPMRNNNSHRNARPEQENVMNRFILSTALLALVLIIAMIAPTAVNADTLYAHDPFDVSDGGSATTYDLNEPDPYNTGTIHQQGPMSVGFDGSTSWNSTSHYITDAEGLTYTNGQSLATSGGSVIFGNAGGTRKAARDMTVSVDANLDVVYLSGLMRYDDPVNGSGDYTGWGVSSSSGDRDLTFGASDGPADAMRYGLGVQSGTGNAPGTEFGDAFDAGPAIHLYVLKIEFNAGANGTDEKITVWVNPDLSLNESGNTAALSEYEAEAFANSSDISRFVFYSYGLGNLDIYYDELRLGDTWASVTPTLAVPTPAALPAGLVLLAGIVARRR